MSKQIFFIVLISTNMLIHSMDILLYNPDILSHVTHELCVTHKYRTSPIRKNIANLSQVTKAFCSYYDNEKTKQALIRQISYHLEVSDTSVAKELNCKKIYRIIDDLHNKKAMDLKISFTNEELTDYWYLTSTTGPSRMSNNNVLRPILKQSLLTSTLWIADLKKISQLIDVMLKAKIHLNALIIDALRFIETSRRNRRSNGSPELFLAIATLLLEQGADPDIRKTIDQNTALMWAVINDDKEYSRLLLTFGANPEKIKSRCKKDIKKYSIDTILECTPNNPWRRNVFNMEPTGWLEIMVDEINGNTGKQNLLTQLERDER